MSRSPRMASPVAVDDSIFDEEAVLRLFAGDRALAKTIVQKAADALPGYFDNVQEAIAAADWVRAERAVHVAKGLVAQVGGVRLAARLEEAERKLHRGERIEAAAVLELRRELARLKEELLQWTQ